MALSEDYVEEKIDAYTVAIESLRLHESSSGDVELARALRERLARKLERELDRWLAQYA